MNQTKLYDILREAATGIILLTEDSTQEFDDAVDEALRHGFLKKESKDFCKITEKGKTVLRSGSYEQWQYDQRPRNERVFDLLNKAKSHSLISLTKSDTDEHHSLVLYAFDKGYLNKTAGGAYRLSSDGHDVLEAGSIERWKQAKNSSQSQNPHTYYSGPVIQKSIVTNGDFSSGKNLSNSFNNHGISDKPQKKWYEKTQVVIAILAGIAGIATFLLKYFFHMS
jgi:hypothetical protein